MQNPVFYGAFLAISWIKPRSVVTNYSECVWDQMAYRDVYVTRSQIQRIVGLCSHYSLFALWVFQTVQTPGIFHDT